MSAIKVKQEGTIEDLSQIISKTSGTQTFKMQTLILNVEDQYGKNQYWEFVIYNQAAEGEGLLNRFKKGDKVIVEAWLNSREFRFKTNGPYSYELRIAAVKNQ
jgi:single-stranded DNA-binding protein